MPATLTVCQVAGLVGKSARHNRLFCAPGRLPAKRHCGMRSPYQGGGR